MGASRSGIVPGPFDPAAGRLSGHIRFAQCKQAGAGGLVGYRSRGGVYRNEPIIAIFFKVSFPISLLARGSTRETKKRLYPGGIVGGGASKSPPFA